MANLARIGATAALSALALLWLVPTQVAAAVDEPATVAYKLSRWGLTLGEVRFSHDGLGKDCYLYRGVAVPQGLAALFVGRAYGQSVYCLVEGRIQPQRFEYVEAGDPEDSYELAFDWRAGTVRLANGESRRLPSQPYDQLSLQLGIRRLLMQREKNLPERPFSLSIVEEDRIREYSFEVTGEQRLQTALGEFDTLRVERVDETSKRLRFWLAPALFYLPVRIEVQDEDAGIFLLTLKTLSGQLG